MPTTDLCPLPRMLRVKDLADYMQISTRLAYQMVKAPGFPLVTLTNKCFRVPRDAFLAWLEEQAPYKQINDTGRSRRAGRPKTTMPSLGAGHRVTAVLETRQS